METSEISSLFCKFILNIIEYLVDKPNGHLVLKGIPSSGIGVEVKEL